ncbi:MAG: hypothetical protein PHQ36_11460, partial [Anaerolineales bacterium]|nr:hypothetical protein [Anaerolineales bacterium]
MFAQLHNFFNEETDTDPSFLRITRTILIVIMAGNAIILFLVSSNLGSESHYLPATFILLLSALIFEAIAFYYVNRGKPGMAKLIVPLALIITITFSASTY